MKTNAFSTSVFVITGAASGIGRELAIQASGRGAQVIATDSNGTALEETRQLALTRGKAIETALLDVADKEAIQTFARTSIPRFENRRLVLINNAGVALSSGSFNDTSLDDFTWLMNINLWGAIYLTKAFYPYFISRGEGHIVNLSSVFGLIGVENQSAYCTSKFALRGFTETLRMELAGTRIQTTVVHPGGIKTNIVRNARISEALVSQESHRQNIALFDKMARTTAARAAEKILWAVIKKKQRLVIGRDGLALDKLARLLPVSYTRIIRTQIEKTFRNPYRNKS